MGSTKNNLGQNSFGTAATVGIIILICLLGWGSMGKATTPKPQRLGIWESSPNIEVCDSSPMSLVKVEKAVQWWTKLGYSFGKVHPQRPNGPCVTGNMGGYITIGELKYPTASPGITWLHVHKQHITWAKIELENTRSRIVEHEIGHALGWSHVSTPGHIMNPNLELGGWNTQGL